MSQAINILFNGTYGYRSPFDTLSIGILKFALLILFFQFCTNPIKAQDPFFSSVKLSSTIMSPAQIGNFEGDYRLGLSYRSQWFSFDNSSGFTTYRASGEYKLASRQGDYWSFGLDLLNDQSGIANLRMTKFQIGGSYTLLLSQNLKSAKESFVRFGTQIGLGQNSLSWSELWFGRQYDFNIFQVNQTIDNGEDGYDVNGNSGNTYPDINIGFFFKKKLSDISAIEIDLSGHHLNAPSIGFEEDLDNKLDRKINTYVEFSHRLSESIGISPSYFWSKQGISQYHLIGSALDFINEESNSFSLMLNTRLNKSSTGLAFDALIFGAKAEVGGFLLGLAYDLYISDVSNGNRQQGAFEFHLIYKSINH